MPWKENRVLDQRSEFVMRAARKEMSFARLCREYGISAKTGYKWKARYLVEGVKGLADQSRRPKHNPEQACEEVVCRVVRIKQAHRFWGPRKIHDVYCRSNGGTGVSLSTVKRILRKAGLVEKRKVRTASACGTIENRVAAEAPNELWTVDFKGWWYSTDQKRVEPLTVQDAYSRYVLCAEIVADARTETVSKSFERLFARYGLPKSIRSDNGAPFASYRSPLGLSRLSAWWVSLGIGLDRIRPGHPEENGGHERMHRDLSREVERHIACEWSSQQPALDVWRRERNEERPHEALGMRMPAEVYQKSKRVWRPGKTELEYPHSYQQRSVTEAGQITVDGVQVRISAALWGWKVGLKKLCEKSYSVWFGALHLGVLDLETEKFEAQKTTSA